MPKRKYARSAPTRSASSRDSVIPTGLSVGGGGGLAPDMDEGGGPVMDKPGAKPNMSKEASVRWEWRAASVS